MLISEFAAAYPIGMSSKLVKDDKTSFDWEVTLTFNDKTFVVPFHCGRGWQERYSYVGHKWVKASWEEVIEAEKRKKYGEPLGSYKMRPEAPTLVRVLSSLHSDVLTIEESPLWKSWAKTLGFNVDSIENRKCYKRCRKTYLGLHEFFGQLWQKFLDCQAE